MALDHYVPQVHLKRFYSPELGERFYAISKSSLKCFKPNSKGVCAINFGSTNSYLKDDRAIEQFLAEIESKYNTVVAKIHRGDVDHDCVLVINGLLSSIIVCSPTGMRIQSEPLRASVQSTAEIMEKNGLFPPPPPELGGKTVTDLLRAQDIQIDIDPKYPQAIGISQVLKLTGIFGNSKWEILHNTYADCPFFTSDFPIAIERSKDPRVLNRVFPLTPTLAVRILPDLSMRRAADDLSFSNFGFISKEPGRSDIIEINRKLVQCAEDLIFFRDDRPWVVPFVKKNKDYWIEATTQVIEMGGGKMLISQQRISNRKKF
jgi:Protein of unknown function (DUF4238)